MKKIFFIALTLLTQPLYASDFYSNSIGSLISMVDSFNNCAGNGGSLVGQYDVHAFDSSIVAKAVKKKNESCHMNYSTSKKDAIKMYYDFMQADGSGGSFSDSTYSCVQENVGSYETGIFESVLNDPSNIAVFSSVFDDNYDESESCSDYSFYVYRASGVVIVLNFNHTD